MNEIKNGSQTTGLIQCAARCGIVCGACGLSPIPGDEFYGAFSGAAAGTADWA